MNVKKVTKTLFTLLLASSIALCGNANILRAYAADQNTIPKNMAPGTVITYDVHGKMYVIKEGQRSNDNLSKEDLEKINKEKELLKDYPISDTSLSLPKIQSGLTVFYDGLGQPLVIRLNGKTLTSETTTQNNENTKNVSGEKSNDINAFTYGYYATFGRITWYNAVGHIGFDQKLLTWKDCATKIGIDTPAAGTLIYVTKSSDNTKTVLQKYDIGLLPNAILDISKEAMNNIFKVPAGYNSNGVPYGEFLGSYYHF